MEPLTEVTLARLLLQLVVILGVARGLGEMLRRIGQPPVVGELAAGILLGPTVLARVAPGVHAWLFPGTGLQQHLLETVAFLGLIFLLLLSGIEVDTRVLRQLGWAATLVAALGFLVPFALGAWAGWTAPADFIGPKANRVLLTLFLGTALGITALPVIAKILLDLNAMRRNVGVTILGAAMAQDLVGWTLLFVIVKLAQEGGWQPVPLVQVGATVGLFLWAAYRLGRPVLRWVLELVDERMKLEYATLTTVALFTFFYAAITQAIGIHAVFGAFLAGVTVARSRGLRPQTRETVREFSLAVFTPVFFCTVGLQVDLFAVERWGFFGWVLLLAVAGKVAGATLGGMLGRMRAFESFAIGVGMNARGAMELVLGVVGYTQGLISRELFSIIVLLAMVTSIMTPPLMRQCLRRLPMSAEEELRARQAVEGE
jgi:Kef-type K+ transport system membrane component KefB